MGNLGRTDPGCADDGWDVRSTRSGGRGIDPIRTVLEAVAAPMAAVGSAGQVVHWNAAAARLFGRSAHEVAGRGLAHVVPANASDASILLVLLRAPVCGARRCVDIAIVGRDGREAVLETTVSPVASSELGPVAALVSFVDVTATRTGAAEEAPAAIAESCAEGIVYASLEGTVLMANAAVATMFGCSQADVIGRPLSSLHPPLQWAKLRDALAGARAGRSLAPELVGLRGDGSEFVTSSTLSPVQGADGRVRGVFAIVRDLSAGGSPRSGSALDALEMPAFSWAQAASAANVLIVGTTIVFASTAAVEMVGARDLAEVVGRDVFDFVAPTSKEATVARHESANAGRWPRQELITIKRVDGQEKQVELASKPVLWDERQHASQLTMWEPVRGADRLQQVATGIRVDVAEAVVIVDTNSRIQSFNESAERLYGWREAEVIGQELDVVIPWFGNDADRDTAQRRLREEGRWHGRAAQRRRDGGVVHVLASTTLLTDGSGQPAGAISVNRPIGDDVASAADPAGMPALGDDLRRGLANDELVVVYQPIVRLDDATPVGVEALVRWDHPTRGLLLPGEFIEVAERTGLIDQLGALVVELACRQVQQWRAAGIDLYLSVNVSARQLADVCLPARLADILQRTGLNPEQLWIEITETALVEDLEQARTGLHQIDELGVHVSIDDFGTGWASLTYLHEFPVHALKIDQVFVDGLGRRPCDEAIVKSIIGLARELGLDVVAEGIETLDQRALLYQLGCEKGQGYLFGVPVPAAELVLMAHRS